jgi:hypothetical protein
VYITVIDAAFGVAAAITIGPAAVVAAVCIRGTAKAGQTVNQPV